MSKDMRKYISFFRIATLFFATILFMQFNVQSIFATNLTIIGCLILSSSIVIYFIHNIEDETKLLLVIVMESLGLLVIVINTGQFFSYYFWMLLNPLLLAIHSLKGVRRRIFLVTNVLMVLVLLQRTGHMTVLDAEVSHILFGFFSILAFSMILATKLERLEQTSRQIRCKNETLGRSIDANQAFAKHIVTSAQLMEELSYCDTFDQCMATLQDYLAKWTDLTGHLLIDAQGGKRKVVLLEGFKASELTNMMDQVNLESKQSPIVKIQRDQGPAAYVTRCFFDDRLMYIGIIGNPQREAFGYDYATLLAFVRKQVSIQTARIKLLAFQSDLLISGEQNRIAQEIHDQVNQQIFAASCMVYQVKGTLGEGDIHHSQDQLNKLYDLMKDINKELKRIVYKMSAAKNAHYTGVDRLQRYLKDLGVVYDIHIYTAIDETFNFIREESQYGIFRVINEAIVNAVKHGNCNKVEISLSDHGDRTQVLIEDDGCGFSKLSHKENQAGIGLSNMQCIADDLDGTLEITSGLDQGTTVRLVV